MNELNQNAAADAAQNNAANAEVANLANGADAPQQQPQPEAPKAEGAVEATKSLLEIAQLGSKEEGFKLQCEKFGKILTDESLSKLEEKVHKRLTALKTYQSNLENLLVEIHQKQAAERFEELKAIYADLSPEQKAALTA
ncbi:MAG: hypothetical protein NC548_59845 [Lachnospiraceae bacterium]|nr:hypothetical protein [Lachnospiraceae bacterium]